MKQPTFLFVGPDKAGSSWLYHILSKHPDCFVPPAKDIYYFDRYYYKGLDWYWSHFRDAPQSAVALGELSHDYLFSRNTAERIRKVLPEAAILICLRNPIDRSVSQFQYMRRGGEVGNDFWKAVEAHPKIVDNSRYLANVRNYVELFGRAQVHLLVFDDLVADARAFGQDVLVRLGLRLDVDLPYQDRVREAGMARSAALSRSLKAGANLARLLGLSNIVGRVKHSRAAGLAYREMKPEERVRLSADDKMRLWGIFAPEIPELSRLVGRDLSHWAPNTTPMSPHSDRC